MQKGRRFVSDDVAGMSLVLEDLGTSPRIRVELKLAEVERGPADLFPKLAWCCNGSAEEDLQVGQSHHLRNPAVHLSLEMGGKGL